jgi:tRNA modification GTPase
VQQLVDALIALRTYVEACLDFPDEDIDFLADGQVQARLAAIAEQLHDVEQQAHQGQLLREGMTLVIAGQPNAGKSSLLNALSGRETAIVTHIPGTTRDVLREHIQIDGMPLHVIDTAGLRDSSDPIEQEGVRRAWAQIEQADRVLLVIDDQRRRSPVDQAILERLPHDLPHTLVFNKIDLSGREPGIQLQGAHAEVALSARSGAGVTELRSHLKQVMGYSDSASGSFSARRRHLDALQRAELNIAAARQWLGSGELLAEELRLAQQHLCEITGGFTSDDLLGEIFASFCIGK